MRRLLLSFFAVVLVGAMAGPAASIPFPFNVENDIWSGIVNGIPTARCHNDGIPDIFDAVNLLAGTAYTHNTDIDPRFWEPDYVWTQAGGQVALIGLTASYHNTLGVYTGIGTGQIGLGGDVLGPYSGYGFLGDGTMGNPYPGAVIGLSSGTQFGWYLNSSGIMYYSEPGLNADTYDHVMTFEMPDLIGQTVYVDYGGGATQYTFSNPYLLTWEDYENCGDQDYDDMIYLFDRVRPIPEPISLLLLGSGLLGLAVARRVRRR